MKRRISIFRAAFYAVGVAALFLAQGAKGDIVDYSFTTNFSGTPPPSTLSPWLNMRFEDVGPGTVRLSISNLSLTGGEFMGNLFFNLDPADSPGSLLFQNVSSSGGFDLPTITKGVNTEKADGDGFYDFKLDFKTTGNMGKRFSANEWLSYDLTGVPGLTVYDFVYLSLPGGGSGTFYAAGHMQGLANDGSRWISPQEAQITIIPEPAPVLLFAMGLGLLIVEHSTRRSLRKR